MLNFSVLISVYCKENPQFLKLALNSIWVNQTLKPSEVVIVKDGRVTADLDVVIDKFCKIAPVKIVSFIENRGLGVALAKGLENCTHEIVARMDADDIAMPDRFEKQIEFLVSNFEYDIIGSNIAEFENSENKIIGIRNVPNKFEDIIAFSKKRNPLNHMTVMFKRSSVLAAGNYLPLQGYEDYYLWIRMINNGCMIYNIQEELMLARVGDEMLIRRQGVNFYKQEIKLQKLFYKIGYINYFELVRNIFCRAFPRLFPIFLLRYIYKLLRSKE